MCDCCKDEGGFGPESILSSTSRQSATTWAIGEPKLLEPHGPRANVTVEQVKARINEMYESGLPFFTKKAIQDVWDQFQGKTTVGVNILTKDLIGDSLEWKVKLGESIELRYCGDEEEYKLKNTYKNLGLQYRSALHLKRDLDRFNVTTASYSPLQLSHQLVPVTDSNENKGASLDDSIKDWETVAQDFKEQTEAWEKTESCKNLMSSLRSFAGGHPINKVIGLACGSLAMPNNKHAAIQTALLVTVKKWLQKRDNNSELSCYIQDPMNTPVDKEVLANNGLEMIDDPRGWLEVDEQSFVLSIAPNVPVKEIIADIARPAILVWYKVEDEDTETTDPSTPRVREMLEGYDLYECLNDEEWERVVMYIRKSEVPPTPNKDGTFRTLKSGN